METLQFEIEKVETSEDQLLVSIPMSYEEYLNWNPDDGFLYEFNDGFAEPKNYMEPNQLYIVSNILEKFVLTKASQEKSKLLQEIKFRTTDKQMRIADMALLTAQQLKQMANDENTVPDFVVEIISKNDEVNKVEQKLAEYFMSGVKTVWHIFPLFKKIQIYTSLRDVKIALENDTFDASPAIPDLQMSVSELFAI